MGWQWYTVLAIAIFTTLNLVQRVGAKESEDPRAFSVAFNLAGGGIALVLFLLNTPFRAIAFPNEGNAWIIILFAVLFYGLFERGRFYAAKYLEASVLTTVLSCSLLVSVVGSVLFLSESLTAARIIGTCGVLISIVLVSYQKQRVAVSSKGLLIGVLISIMLGAAWVLDKKAMSVVDPNVYVLLLWLLPVLVVAVPSISTQHVIREFRRSGKIIFLMAGLNVIGYIMQLRALRLADATIVLPLIQLTNLTTIFGGILLLKEREHFWKKILAGGLALIGAYFLL